MPDPATGFAAHLAALGLETLPPAQQALSTPSADTPAPAAEPRGEPVASPIAPAPDSELFAPLGSDRGGERDAPTFQPYGSDGEVAPDPARERVREPVRDPARDPVLHAQAGFASIPTMIGRTASPRTQAVASAEGPAFPDAAVSATNGKIMPQAGDGLPAASAEPALPQAAVSPAEPASGITSGLVGAPIAAAPGTGTEASPEAQPDSRPTARPDPASAQPQFQAQFQPDHLSQPSPAPATVTATPSIPFQPQSQPPTQPAAQPLAPAIDQIAGQIADMVEAGRTLRPEFTLRHGDFGTVALRLDPGVGQNDWRATLSARDPGFVPAVQAAIAERGVMAASESALSQGLAGQNGGNSSASGQQNGQQTGQHPGPRGGEPGGAQSGASHGGQDQRYGSSTGSDHALAKPYSGEEAVNGAGAPNAAPVAGRDVFA
jgi:Meckel syndrome type 1 protein